MLELIEIKYSIGERVLLSNVSFNINVCDRFALVGANGTGKTTLLRIITGDLLPTSGSVNKPKSFKIGYLPQEEIVLHGNTLIDEVLKDFNLQLRKLSALRKLMSENPHSKKILDEYDIAEEDFQSFGGYEYESEAYKVISGLGFTGDDYTRLVQEFSSGWQMRVVLARLLLNKPDLLLLDEPTNHLDIESIQWFENYLQEFKGAMIIVSHDRYFLDKILQHPKGTIGVYEIDFGRFRRYRTNYSGYLQESKMRKQRLIQLAKTQEKRIKEIEEFVVRNRANKSKAKLVKSREKYLRRIERIQIETERKKIKVQFPIEGIHSRRIVELKKISKSYNDNIIFNNVDLSIESGDKIALIGKNGAGKSTLCRIIGGLEQSTSGERKISERLKIGAFSHDILLKLDKQKTVLDEVLKDAPPAINQRIRGFLGLFLFSGGDVNKKIDILSGGEKTRLVILKTMIEPSNLLILDEPTYHLDKDSVEAIKQAVQGYGGTTILVSHDRDLIADFATRIIELKNGRLYDYPGDYSYYLWKKNKTFSRPVEKKSKTAASPVDRIRNRILQKEERRNKLRESFSRPGVMSDLRKSKKLFEEYQRLSEEIEELEDKLTSEAT